MAGAGEHPTRRRMREVFGAERVYDIKAAAWTRIELVPDATVPDDFKGPFSSSARLLRELDTARAVTAAMFAGSGELTVELTWTVGPNPRHLPSPFKRLRQLGLDLEPDPAFSWHMDPDEPEWTTHQQFTTVAPTEDALAPWLIAATGGFQDRGLINLGLDLIDFERGLALEFYDAKGMTPMATTAEALAPIYWRFRDWAIDFVVERCDEEFAPWRPAGI